MNCEQANKISIIEFLRKKNINPVKRTGRYTFFYSPFRSEKEPSFTVNNKNRWRDFGSGKHGTLVDLVMELQSCNESEALKFIANSSCSFSFKEQEFIEDSNIKIRNVRPYVKHKALLDYLEYRAIKPLDLVKHELKEVWYTKDDNLYFGIAFESDLGGFELRNRIYKNCIGRKAITTKLNGKPTILIWEGFLDYISYVLLSGDAKSEDHLILNSTSMYEDAIPILKKYEKVIAYLDNDNPGKDCFENIKKEVPWIVDRSHTFSPYKDLNEYLMQNGRLVR